MMSKKNAIVTVRILATVLLLSIMAAAWVRHSRPGCQVFDGGVVVYHESDAARASQIVGDFDGVLYVCKK